MLYLEMIFYNCSSYLATQPPRMRVAFKMDYEHSVETTGTPIVLEQERKGPLADALGRVKARCSPAVK